MNSILTAEHLIFDVRSPAEYAAGHIPGAINLPLFSNEERAEVGTLYKQVSPDSAMLRGLEIVGPKMATLVKEAKSLFSQHQSSNIILYCWRGGKRSSSVAWLLETAGLPVTVFQGGYKNYRNKVFEVFKLQRKIIRIGGKTGSGKTEILQHLQAIGQQIIDLERIANHKGSAFGSLGEKPQPTEMQFQNELATNWQALDPTRPVFIEDESRMIGRLPIPEDIWKQMRQSEVLYIDSSLEERVQYLVHQYGQFSKEQLLTSLTSIERKLGGVNHKDAITAIESGDLATATRIILQYYDSCYAKGLNKTDSNKIFPVHFDLQNSNQSIQELIQTYQNIQKVPSL